MSNLKKLISNSGRPLLTLYSVGLLSLKPTQIHTNKIKPKQHTEVLKTILALNYVVISYIPVLKKGVG